MDVYLVPVGPECYELYCESADDSPVAHEESSNGLFRRLQERFSQMLAAVERESERERARLRSRPSRDGFLRRLRARSVRWVAERVAEQRLLWRLRGQTEVRAFHPTQLDEAGALAVIRGQLARDLDKHSRWLVLDAVALVLAVLLLTLFPGPNVPGYYFTFRVVGHYFAIRGARQGLRKVHWALQASAPLGRLAELDGLPPGSRLEGVKDIERELGLCKLARFYERIVAGPA